MGFSPAEITAGKIIDSIARECIAALRDEPGAVFGLFTVRY
jgi:hypothetical protein